MEFKIRPDGKTRTFRVLKTVDVSSVLGDLWYEFSKSFQTFDKAQEFVLEKVAEERKKKYQAQLDKEWEEDQGRRLLTYKV